MINKFDMGGVETWLINVVQNLPQRGYHFDFFAISSEEALLEKDVIKQGCQVFRGSKQRPTIFSIYNDLKKLIDRIGSYDAIHSHVHHFSGVIMLLGFFLKIPVRIVHSHSDTRFKEDSSGILRRAYIVFMRMSVWLFATKGIGVSSSVAEDQFGSKWKNDKRWMILPCGVDFKRFDIPKDEGMKLALGIPLKAKVVGHVGRFDEPKNHDFLIKVFKCLVDQCDDVYLVLIGVGPLRQGIERKVRELSISNKVLFLGVRNDVPEILRSVVDVFLFPSLYEGLPLALVEAQLAGCFCVVADNISREVILNENQVMSLSLGESLSVWVSKVSYFLLLAKEEESGRILSQYVNSYYDLRSNMKRFLSVYCI